jgi:PAB-dependent poly(A)-specific ribonuclease subunit 2
MRAPSAPSLTQLSLLLSLSSLPSYLLGLDMQTADHDSVTDARTALLCYREYERLVASGEFAATLQDMYSKGQQTGWKMVNGIRLS